jgi:hypothetical protein
VYSRRRWVLRAAPEIVVQFKKLNSKGLPANYPTAAALAYQSQQLLKDFPPGMRLTLGYTLNDTATEVVEVRLVAQDGRRTIISEELETSQASLYPLFAETKAAKGSGRKYHAKKDAQAERDARKKNDKKTR